MTIRDDTGTAATELVLLAPTLVALLLVSYPVTL